MAASPDPPPSGESMLQLALESMRRASQPLLPLSRLCLVGQTAEGGGKAWEKFCTTIVREAPDDGITGLLLVLPSGWVMLAEGSHPALMSLLHAIRGQQGKLIHLGRVIHQSEDVPARFFSAWGTKATSVVRHSYSEVDPKKIPAFLSEIVISMLKIGQGVGPMGSRDLERIESWTQHFPEIPSNDLIGQVLEMEEVPTIAQFLDYFHAPVDIEMQSDRVWPPERPMIY